jgi:hypothetical protein
MILLASHIQGAEWVPYVTGGGADWYYDEETIHYQDKNIVRVWIKYIRQDEEGAKRYIEWRKNSVQSVDGFDKWQHSKRLDEINCSTRQDRTLSITEYGEEQKIIYERNFDGAKWEHITPENASEALYKIVCDMAKKQTPTKTKTKGVK